MMIQNKRTRPLNNTITISTTEKLFDFLDKYQSKYLTPIELLEGTQITYKDQVKRMLVSMIYDMEQANKG